MSISDRVLLVDSADQVPALLGQIREEKRIALDIESNGLHAYRPSLCVIQVAWRSEGEVRVAVIDPLQIPPAMLADVLRAPDVAKVVHDLSFDARMLHGVGIDLEGVRDTSLMAFYLGRHSTGLASLAASELGVKLDKGMQTHDWARRPLMPEALAYLAADVRHVLALDDVLSEQIQRQGIEDEVADETSYRLLMAMTEAGDRRPLFARLRGIESLDERGQSTAKHLAMQRETLAQARDVPPFRVFSDGLLIALARSRPAPEALQGQRGIDATDSALVWAVNRAIEIGSAEGALSQEDAAWLVPQVPSVEELAARRAVEREAVSWRKKEAKRRGVSEQVVLPGHCVRRLASQRPDSTEAVAAMAGLGSARATRYAGILSELVRRAQKATALRRGA